MTQAGGPWLEGVVHAGGGPRRRAVPSDDSPEVPPPSQGLLRATAEASTASCLDHWQGCPVDLIFFSSSVFDFFPTKGAVFPDPISFYPQDISKFLVRHETRRGV